VSRPERRNDRWLTPGVVKLGIVVVGLVVLGVAALVALMVQRGLDPSPVLTLASTTAAALGSIGSVVLQLYGRRSQTKTERHAGTTANLVDQLVAELYAANRNDDRRGDAGGPETVLGEQTRSGLPPVPPARPRPRHSWPAEWANGSGPDGGRGGE